MFAFRNLLTLPLSATGNLVLGATISPNILYSPLPATNLITQRWKYRARKPIGSPRSRKKRYWVRPPTPRDPEEYAELFWRYAHYRTQRRSLGTHFAQWKGEHYPQEALPATKELTDAVVAVLDPEFAKALEENDAENAKVAKVREARRLEELRVREEERLDVLAGFESREAIELPIREEQIRRKKEIAKRLVTPETLLDRINWAFDNPTDYNFAVDLKGRRVYGRPDPLRKLNMFYTQRGNPRTWNNSESLPSLDEREEDSGVGRNFKTSNST